MRLIWNPTRTRFEFESRYDERDVPKSARFRWDPDAKRWWTADEERARALIRYATTDVLAMLEGRREEHTATVAASRAEDTDMIVPSPPGLEYRPYQRAGIAYALREGGRYTLIADEPGLGKTIQAIGVVNAKPEIRRVLVICPASLRLNWEREVAAWLVAPRPIRVVLDGRNWPTAHLYDDPDAGEVVIINYDLVAKHRERLLFEPWDLIVCDESHYLKNYRTQRTKSVFGGGRHRLKPLYGRRWLFLTGTPILNRPFELFAMLRFCFRDEIDYYQYIDKYCGGDVRGASNLDDLQAFLRSRIMVRRRKADVLKELPAKQRQIIEIPAREFSDQFTVEMQRFLERDCVISTLEQAVRAAKTHGDEGAFRSAFEKLKQARGIAFEEMARERHANAVRKIPYVLAHLDDNVDGKCVVFAHHREVLDAVMEKYGNAAVRFDGSTSLTNRQAAVDRFQIDSECRVFAASIRAAGLGITLTASSHVVFAEIDWSPFIVSQAEDRLHRIGQTESVLVQHIVLEGSIDALMARRIIEKLRNAERALDTTEEGLEVV